MGNLLTSLLNSANAMKAFDRQLVVIQNNVANASTPGYARQLQPLEAIPFQPDAGWTGGVAAGPMVNTRSEYAELSVRRQVWLLGEQEQKATDLAQVEALFDLSEDHGVSGALNNFFQSFSQLSISPGNAVSRQAVIDRANDLAQEFNQTAAGLAGAASSADRQVSSVVGSINKLATQIRDLNALRRQDFQSTDNPGLEAKVYSTLEQLSEFADVSVLREQDGTYSVYLGGQTPLVIGDHQFELQVNSSATATTIVDANGRDVTAQVSHGKLKALLDERNTIIPGYLADLNRLAASLADTVNTKLAAGVDASGAPPAVDLFTYDPLAGSAMSLAVTGITPDQIAAAAPGAPGGNANALDIAALSDVQVLDGYTFTEFYGNLGARVGRDLDSARTKQSTQQSLVTQARTMRDETSGVSFDEEAARLLEVQRAYQAAGKLLGVLNEITDTLMQIVRV